MNRLFDEIKTGPYAHMTFAEKFNLFYQKKGVNDCWEYMGKKYSNGYGCFTVGKSGYYLAHRVSFFLSNGGIEANKVVMHTCDNRICVNPHHLVLGTHRDNVKDMVEKGRCNPPHGSRCGMSKLKESDIPKIKEMRRQGFLMREIAENFPVTATQIVRIINRQQWGHLGDTR